MKIQSHTQQAELHNKRSRERESTLTLSTTTALPCWGGFFVGFEGFSCAWDDGLGERFFCLGSGLLFLLFWGIQVTI